MAVSTSPLTTQFIDIIAESTDLESAVYVDIAGKPVTLYAMTVVNAADAAIHVKLYNTAVVVPGTTVPEAIFMVVNGTTRTFVTTDGLEFTAALSARAVTEAGTPGTTDPSSSCTVRFFVG